MVRIFFILLIALAFSTLTKAETITLTEDNHVAIRTEIDDSSITKAELELTALVAKRGSKNYTIYVVLDSPGGSISSGLNFIEFAKSIKNVETVTIFAASMAAGIVEALPGNRNIIETDVLMFHRARGGVEGQFENGELESRLGFYKEVVLSMEQKNADRLKLTLADYKAKVKDEMWILGNKAVKANAADTVIDLKCTDALIKKQITETISIMGLFSIKVTFSSCPLIRGGAVTSGDTTEKDVYVKYRQEKYGIFNK